MVKEVKNGQMGLNTLEDGMKIRYRDKVNFCMPIKTSMKASSSLIEPMALAAMCKNVERHMKVFGQMISLMVKENLSWKMARCTKASSKMD